jgi:hypothetical protein
VKQVVQYAQGQGPFAVLAPEKSDLNIATDMSATGVLKTADYMLADHQKISDGGQGSGIIDEYLRAADGFDWRLVYTAATRTLTSYYPNIGTDRTGYTFRYVNLPDAPAKNGSWGLIGWTYGDSIESTANQVCELSGWGGSVSNGAGDAFATREEGGYSNPATLGGLTLELVESAPQGTNVGQLGQIARARGRLLQHQQITPQLVMAEPTDPVTGLVTFPLIGVLLPGDLIDVDLQDGEFVLQGTQRCAQVTLDCTLETLTVVPNPLTVAGAPGEAGAGIAHVAAAAHNAAVTRTGRVLAGVAEADAEAF